MAGFLISSNVVLCCGHEILLIRRNNTSFGEGMLALVAGHVEQNEDPWKAASREIYEEIGLKISESEMGSAKLITTRIYKSFSYIDFYYRVDLREKPTLLLESGKISEALWCCGSNVPGDTIDYVADSIDSILSSDTLIKRNTYVFNDNLARTRASARVSCRC